jgi:hypothetical protein
MEPCFATSSSATEVNYASPSTITIDGVIDAAWSNYPAINITRPFTVKAQH